MERTSFKDSDYSNPELKKLMATLYNVVKYIPGCQDLDSDCEFMDYWTPGKQDDSDAIPTVKRAIRKGLRKWLISAPDKEIVSTLRPLKMNKKLRPFLLMCKSLVAEKYKGFFETDFKGLPNDMAVPTPFLVMERTGENIKLTKPIIRRYGQTRTEIRGTVLRAEDAQLTMALLILMHSHKPSISEKVMSFTTSIIEIAETLGKNYPRSASARETIWAGLTRLNDCRMTLTNAKGLRTLGGILSGAKELEEDSNLEIRIHLDRDFINLIDEGYTSIKPAVYFPLKPTLANLYLYFSRQRSFNTANRLEPVSIFKVYDYAGLGGINPDAKPNSQKRFEIKKALKELERLGVINFWSVKKDMLEIRAEPLKAIEAPAKPKIQEEPRRQIQPKTCPHGFNYGVDWNIAKECKHCLVAEKCYNND